MNGQPAMPQATEGQQQAQPPPMSLHGCETPDRESPLPPQLVKSESNKKMRNAWGNMSYAELITQAILSTPEKRLTLSEIYDWIVKNVPYFADKANSPSTAGWKVSLCMHARGYLWAARYELLVQLLKTLPAPVLVHLIGANLPIMPVVKLSLLQTRLLLV